MKTDGRSIFGYFTDRNDAESAKDRLIQAGIEDIQLDSVSRTSQGGRPDQLFNPSTGDFDSLSRLTMGADVGALGDDTGILLSADTSASGYGGGAEPQEAAWMIVAVTDGSDAQVERAVKIMKSHGANV